MLIDPNRSDQAENPQEPSRLTKWECIHTFQAFEIKSTSFVYGNETISYACLNMIITWNYKTKNETKMFVPLEKDDSITALAVLESQDFLMGTEKGSIYIEGHFFGKIWESPVIEIMMIGPAHVIIKCKNNSRSLINIYNGAKFDNFKPDVQICRFKENFFATLHNGCVSVMSVDSPTIPKFTENGMDKSYSAMRAQKDQFLLLLHKEKSKFTIWDVEKEPHLTVFEGLRLNIHTNQFETLVLIDSKTFIVPDWDENKNKVFVNKFSYDKDQANWKSVGRRRYAGNCRVTSMICVNDWIVYATANTSFHVFYKNLCYFFSEPISTKNEDLAINALNGCVAVELKSSKSVKIYKFQKDTDVGSKTTPATEYSSLHVRPRQTRKCKKRLFVGEGNFSYTAALIEKHSKEHPNLPRAITATELETREKLEKSDAKDRLKTLKDKGVTLRFGINATKIHEEFPSMKRRFKRIHWNCPYADKAVKMWEGGFKDVIIGFFDSCNKIQQPGDRVHVALMHDNDFHMRQKENPIVLGSALSGYNLIKKRKFGSGRYPGYEHVKTGGDPFVPNKQDNKMREFVFEKVSFGKRSTTKKGYEISKRPVNRSTHYYFVCSTDGSDSSDYEELTDDNDSDPNNDDDAVSTSLIAKALDELPSPRPSTSHHNQFPPTSQQCTETPSTHTDSSGAHLQSATDLRAHKNSDENFSSAESRQSGQHTKLEAFSVQSSQAASKSSDLDACSPEKKPRSS